MNENLNPATGAILAGLEDLGKRVDAVRHSIERRETVSPGMLTLSGTPQSFSQRLRVEHFVITVSAASQVALQIGTASIFTVQTAGAETIVIPLPITIDNGKELQLVGTGIANVVNAFLTYVTDYPSGERS